MDFPKDTSSQFDAVVSKCCDIFSLKTKDYGTSWRVMRTATLTDQLYIKAKRIRTIEENGTHLVEEGVYEEWIAMVNYAIMAIIQHHQNNEELELEASHALALYDKTMAEVKALMMRKNHDYGEAWREMRISSYTDMVLTKLQRLRQIEDNQGSTAISEGPVGHYSDIANYSIFALIRLDEGA